MAGCAYCPGTSFQRAQHEFRDVAQELTNRIVVVIEGTGKLPWKQEWDSSKCAGPQAPVDDFIGEPEGCIRKEDENKVYGFPLIALPLVFSFVSVKFPPQFASQDR